MKFHFFYLFFPVPTDGDHFNRRGIKKKNPFACQTLVFWNQTVISFFDGGNGKILLVGPDVSYSMMELYQRNLGSKYTLRSDAGR